MSKKLQHLLLVTLEDPYHPSSWSGTPYNMRCALEAKIDRVSVLAALKPRRNPKDVALRMLLGGKPPRYPLYLTAASQEYFARRTEAAIREFQPDAVLSISSHCLIGLEPQRIPVFMVTDAPWLAWKEGYRAFEKMPLSGPRFARLEAEAARRCSGLVFASAWAAREAEQLYAAAPEKLHVLPMGANWSPDMSKDELATFIDRRPADRLDLLYVGKDWERKGGPVAVEIACGLRDAGVANVRLHIVGCAPEIPAAARDVVEIHGLLRPGVPEQAIRLRRLFLESHFLVVPTRAECFGLVFAEAHAFGLPAVSRAVHAVPSIILNGETGILEPEDAPAAVYVERILRLEENRDEYRRMAHAARERYETELTWGSFAERMARIISETL